MIATLYMRAHRGRHGPCRQSAPPTSPASLVRDPAASPSPISRVRCTLSLPRRVSTQTDLFLNSLSPERTGEGKNSLARMEKR
ncbi:hypothetical protein LX36DRAFT_656089 [Colletotrichum falcatum]|nr:hypothetical protein LX36DRAFT_656089 [Colletotrichum falcatum]